MNANQLVLLKQLQHSIISRLFIGSKLHSGISSDGERCTVRRTGDANIHNRENQKACTNGAISPATHTHTFIYRQKYTVFSQLWMMSPSC